MASMGRGSEAYDLSLFEPKQAKIVKLVPNKKEEKAKRHRMRVQSLLNTAATLFMAALAVMAVGMIIACRVHLTEMERQIQTRQQELGNLQSEHIRLTSELAAKTSAQRVEDYATGVLGMQKVDPGQIQYITVQGGDVVEVAEPEEKGFLESVGDWFSNIFGELAYLFQ